MIEYANLHFALETIRNRNNASTIGPRVLLLGPSDSGKTSLAKILTSYATKTNRQPLVANLSPREGLLSLPGTLTAAAFNSLIDVEDPWGSSPMSGPAPIPVKLPLTYFYGLPSPLSPTPQGPKNYKSLISRLALAISARLDEDPDARACGTIIDTPGDLSQTRDYDILTHIITELSVSVIVVLGSERLYSDMQRRWDGRPSSLSPSESITVVKLSKSGGAVDRDEGFMTGLRASQVKSYFFGNAAGGGGGGGAGKASTNAISLSPQQQTVDFSSLSIYRLLAANNPSSSSILEPGGTSFLPGGDDPDNFDMDHKPTTSSATSNSIFSLLTTPTAAMQDCILAVTSSPPDAADEAEIRDSSILGFLYVVEVDTTKRKLTVLTPSAGRVPDRAVVWGGWPEEGSGRGFGG